MANSLLVPNVESGINRRRSSYFPLDHSDSRRKSLESLYSSLYTVSISISDSNSSADSVAVGKMQNINRELIELITSRLTALAYFEEAQQEINQDKLKSSINSIQDLKNSLLNENSARPPESEGFLLVSNLIKELGELQKIYIKEFDKLNNHKKELKTLENEENQLNVRLNTIESKFSNMSLESRGQQVTCKCLIQ